MLLVFPCGQAHPPFVGHVLEVAMASRLTRSVPVTVNDVLDGQVALDLDCLDRLHCTATWARCRSAGR